MLRHSRSMKILSMALTIHADLDLIVIQQIDIQVTGKLKSLITIQDDRFTMTLHGIHDHFHHPFSWHSVIFIPADNIPGMQVNDGYKIHKTRGHRTICDVNGPDMIFYIDRNIL
jgi:hypothetical protein